MNPFTNKKWYKSEKNPNFSITKGQHGDHGEENVEEKSPSTIENGQLQKISYPKRVFLILATTFCERFNYFGMTSNIFFMKKSF